MLLPKKTKYRKVRKGKNEGNATRGNYVAFGDYGLQSQGNNDITSRQIEASRQAMTRHIKRGGNTVDAVHRKMHFAVIRAHISGAYSCFFTKAIGHNWLSYAR